MASHRITQSLVAYHSNMSLGCLSCCLLSSDRCSSVPAVERDVRGGSSRGGGSEGGGHGRAGAAGGESRRPPGRQKTLDSHTQRWMTFSLYQDASILHLGTFVFVAEVCVYSLFYSLAKSNAECSQKQNSISILIFQKNRNRIESKSYPVRLRSLTVADSCLMNHIRLSI